MRESLLKALAGLEGDESEEAMKIKKRLEAILQENLIAEKSLKSCQKATMKFWRL